MSSRRRVRITPLGYIVLGIIILVMLVGVYFIIWSMRKNPPADEQSVEGIDAVTPTPSLAPLDSVTVTPTPSLAPLSADTPTLAPVTPVPDPTPTVAPTVDSNSKNVRTPSPSEANGAQDGKLSTGGVVLRAGPSQNHAIIGKYSGGTRLRVYGTEGDYCYVQIVKEDIYGYIASKFIVLATPAPSAPAGAILGTATTRVAMRDKPSTDNAVSNRIGELAKGDQVVIYFQTGEFFYIEFDGKKCYAFSDYIQPEGAVPIGTPVP